MMMFSYFVISTHAFYLLGIAAIFLLCDEWMLPLQCMNAEFPVGVQFMITKNMFSSLYNIIESCAYWSTVAAMLFMVLVFAF